MSLSRILLVDDEPKMTKLLKILLEDELRCEVTVSNDALQALELLQTTDFDLVSLDHRMPQMTGMELLRLLRSHGGPNQACPVLIFTGYLSEVQHLHPVTLEQVLLLEKPINDTRYLRNIKMALKMRKDEHNRLAV